MKRVIYTVLTFIGMFVVVALARRITKDSVGPGFISMAVNIITIKQTPIFNFVLSMVSNYALGSMNK